MFYLVYVPIVTEVMPGRRETVLIDESDENTTIFTILSDIVYAISKAARYNTITALDNKLNDADELLWK